MKYAKALPWLLGGCLLILVSWHLSRRHVDSITSSQPHTPPSPSIEVGTQPAATESPILHQPVEQKDPPRRELDPEKLRAIFQSLMEKHKLAYGQFDSKGSARFRSETDYFKREGRLLALAYPQFARELATQGALNRSLHPWERMYCMFLLQTLAENGHGTANEVYETLLYDADSRVAGLALWGIAALDPEGTRKQLYWTRCRQGIPFAFHIISLWHDPTTISEMRAILQSGANEFAEEVLKRQQILGSDNRVEQLSEILRGEPNNLEHSPLSWAIACMKRHDPERLKQTLRERLDKALMKARKWWEECSSEMKKQGFEKAFAETTNVYYRVDDQDYDDILVAYWETGGKLENVEKERLRNFGYGCDPKERLSELLSTKPK